jgi:hypothetical protein
MQQLAARLIVASGRNPRRDRRWPRWVSCYCKAWSLIMIDDQRPTHGLTICLAVCYVDLIMYVDVYISFHSVEKEVLYALPCLLYSLYREY